MTLVVAIMTESAAYMISDVMLSTRSNGPSLLEDKPYPTKPDLAVDGPYKFAALSQKVVIIAPGFVLGWSGEYAVAVRLIGFFRDSIRTINGKDDVIRAKQDYFALHERDRSVISTIILFEKDDQIYLIPQGMVHINKATQLGKVYAIGSGAGEFLTYLSKAPPPEIVETVNLPPDINIVGFVTSYILHTMNFQHDTGFGVGDGWGGGFEIVLRKEGKNLVKLNNILYASMSWGIEDGNVYTRQIGNRYLQFYVEECLVILSQPWKKALTAHFITIPCDSSVELPASIAAHPTQMLCLLLVNKHTGKYQTPIMYNYDGLDFCGVGIIEGVGLSIRINTDRLKDIIKLCALPDTEPMGL